MSKSTKSQSQQIDSQQSSEDLNLPTNTVDKISKPEDHSNVEKPSGMQTTQPDPERVESASPMKETSCTEISTVSEEVIPSATRTDTTTTVFSQPVSTGPPSRSNSIESVGSVYLPLTQSQTEEDYPMPAFLWFTTLYESIQDSPEDAERRKIYICDYPGCGLPFPSRMDLYVHRVTFHSP